MSEMRNYYQIFTASENGDWTAISEIKYTKTEALKSLAIFQNRPQYPKCFVASIVCTRCNKLTKEALTKFDPEGTTRIISDTSSQTGTRPPMLRLV